MRRIYWHLKKEVLTDYRNPYAMLGSILYVFTLVFIVYKGFNTLNAMNWNLIFWILLTFTSLNAVLKNFIQERGSRALYYYTLYDPLELIIAKIIYNFLVLSILSGFLLLAMSILFINPIANYGDFGFLLIISIIGISIIYSFVSAIASLGTSTSTLMAILAMPLILPVLLIALKVSAQSMNLIQDSSVGTDIILLVGFDITLIGISLILFPFLWKS